MGDLQERLLVRVLDDGDDETVVRGDGEADVEALLEDELHLAVFFFEARVHDRELAEGADDRLHHEGQVSHLDAVLLADVLGALANVHELGALELIDVGVVGSRVLRTHHGLRDNPTKAAYRLPLIGRGGPEAAVRKRERCLRGFRGSRGGGRGQSRRSRGARRVGRRSGTLREEAHEVFFEDAGDAAHGRAARGDLRKINAGLRRHRAYDRSRGHVRGRMGFEGAHVGARFGRRLRGEGARGLAGRRRAGAVVGRAVRRGRRRGGRPRGFHLRSVRLGGFGLRRFRRRGRAATDLRENLADLNHLAFLGRDAADRARHGGRNLDRRLVRHDFEHGLVGGHGVTVLHEPTDEFAFLDAFADIGEFEFHAVLLGLLQVFSVRRARSSRSMSVSWGMLASSSGGASPMTGTCKPASRRGRARSV